MSDENETNNESQENSGAIDAERFKNFQSEFDRKLGNTTSQIEALAQSNQQVLEALNSISSKSQTHNSGDSDSLSSLLYEDPERYAAEVEKRAEERISKKLEEKQQKEQQSQSEVTQVLQQMQSNYPELADPNHELTKRAVEIHNSLSDRDKANAALAYRSAIAEAVSELGIKKVSQRKKSSDYEDFTLSGTSSGTSRSDRSRSKLDKNTILFAEAMGLNTEDKDLLKRLARRSEKNYKKGGPIQK